MEKAKIGEGHAAAMGRAGLKEIGQILPAFPATSVQPVEEPGLAGNLTAQPGVQEKQKLDRELDAYAARGSVYGQAKDAGMER